MPWRFVQQPNGLLARFSTVVDDFTHMDLTEDDAIALGVEAIGRAATLEKLKNAKAEQTGYSVRPGNHLDRWRESLGLIEMTHGKKARRRREQDGTAAPATDSVR